MLLQTFTKLATRIATDHYNKEPTMAGYSVNPGPFKAVPADPEGTLERLEDYCRTMEMVFRLSRRVTATGTKVEFDDSEKKDMIQIEAVPVRGEGAGH